MGSSPRGENHSVHVLPCAVVISGCLMELALPTVSESCMKSMSVLLEVSNLLVMIEAQHI